MSEAAAPGSSEHIELVNIKVFIEGEQIESTSQITELTIYKNLNRINRASIFFLDGDVAAGEFPIMESNKFRPGTSIRVEIGHGTGEENETAFQGIIAQVDVQTHSDKQPLFILRCVDEVFKMSLNGQYYLYENKKDADLFNDLVERNGISIGKIETTSFEHPSIVQFGDSDWDFLLSRAKRIGYIVYTEEGEVFVKKPDTETKSIKLSFGRDIIRQQLSFTAKSIFSNVTANSWNATDQLLRSEDANEIPIPKQGDDNTDTSTIVSAFSDTSHQLLSHADLDTSVISDWASGKLLEYELNKINGFIVVTGTNAPKLDSSVEILKMGNYFTGNGYITGIEQVVRSGKWTTKITVGLKKETWYSNLGKGNQEYGVFGLQIGLVKQIHDDPAGNSRILVEIPGLEGESEGIWARVIQRYATNGAGTMVFPEIGNEVVLGFLSNDAQSPIVLGCLYSQTNSTPFQLEENNNIKAFISNNQLKLSFDEEKREILILTPDGNKISFSDDLKSIKLEDQNRNFMEMNDQGISIESQSDFKLKTKGDLILESMGKVEIKSPQGDIMLKSMNVKSQANMKIENQANIIESKATAQAIIKGGIVQIN